MQKNRFSLSAKDSVNNFSFDIMIVRNKLTTFGQILPKQTMSKIDKTTFGEYIRQLREEKNLPLRKVAAELDIDTSTLSKIEKNERNTNEQIMEKLAGIFQLDISDLKVRYLSDKISYQLLDEEDGIEILKVAEQKIKYYKQQNKK